MKSWSHSLNPFSSVISQISKSFRLKKTIPRIRWLLIFSITLPGTNISSWYITLILLTGPPAFAPALLCYTGLFYTQGSVVILIRKSLSCLFSGLKSQWLPHLTQGQHQSPTKAYKIWSLHSLSLLLFSTSFTCLQPTGLLDIPGTYQYLLFPPLACLSVCSTPLFPPSERVF